MKSTLLLLKNQLTNGGTTWSRATIRAHVSWHDSKSSHEL